MSCGVTAIFTKVEGKVQYRANMDDPWHDATVGDQVYEGTRIRSALKANAELKLVSGNIKATAKVVSGTVYVVPNEIANDGTYETSAAVKHGRADFKVDEVGITNDFRVVAPSTALAVRG